MTEWKVIVSVAQIVSDEELDHEDRDTKPGGKYTYTVEAHCEPDASERALDQFHNEVPIACLDDFKIDTEVHEK